MKIMCVFETSIENVFESNRQLAALPKPDAKIISNEAPFAQYQLFWLDDNFRQYFEATILSKKNIENECSKKHLCKNYMN